MRFEDVMKAGEAAGPTWLDEAKLWADLELAKYRHEKLVSDLRAAGVRAPATTGPVPVSSPCRGETTDRENTGGNGVVLD